MQFNKTLELVDYQRFDRSIQHIKNMQSVMSGVPVRFEHPHRTWEYGLALEALRQNGAKTVLDVGGGGSLFAPAAAWIGMEVLQVDPGDHGEAIVQQSKHIQKPLPFAQMDFMDYPVFADQPLYDAVTCLSVIEHVVEHVLFFARLVEQVKPGGLLCITTDFHPDGKWVSAGHLRTYNQQNMMDWVKFGDHLPSQMFPFGDAPNYDYFEPFVYDYTFAALVLRKSD